jgi:hypothetical protein
LRCGTALKRAALCCCTQQTSRDQKAGFMGRASYRAVHPGTRAHTLQDHTRHLPGFTPTAMLRKLDLSREPLVHLVAMGLGLSPTSEATVGLRFPGVVLRPSVAMIKSYSSTAMRLANKRNPTLTAFLRLAHKLAKKSKHRALSHPSSVRSFNGAGCARARRDSRE